MNPVEWLLWGAARELGATIRGNTALRALEAYEELRVREAARRVGQVGMALFESCRIAEEDRRWFRAAMGRS